MQAKTSRDPFKPTAGTTPPALVGRQHILDDIEYALTGDPGSAEWFNLFVGPRGVGKTVMLNAVEDIAKGLAWHVFSETATTGFMARLAAAVSRSLQELQQLYSGQNLQFKVKFDVAFISAEVSSNHQPEAYPADLRFLLETLCKAQAEIDNYLKQPRTGILITLDELHRNSSDELVSFATTIQHLVRENYPVAVAMAGIPSSVEPLLAADGGNNPITFLRRANQIDLGTISNAEVRKGLLAPVEQAHRTWDPAALEQATAACGGYAYMIQLVGSACFRAARNSVEISQAATLEGINRAQLRLGKLVHEPALRDLSDLDRSFLVQMAKDSGDSKLSDIRLRLNRSSQQINTYKNRLIKAGLIESTGTGMVNFALPYLRNYLQEHFTSEL